MSIANEAGYLYVLSKDLSKLNKKIKKVSKKAQKHLEKHQQATSPEKRQKHQQKHAKKINQVKKLLEEHNQLLAKLRHHQIAFAHQLQKEHQVK